MHRFIGLVVMLAALAAPATALAHHAEGTATCTEATINLIGFGSYDKSNGVDITVKIDGKQVATRHVNPDEFPGSNLTVRVPYSKPQDASSHTVQVYVRWRTSSGYFAKQDSNCTPPKPPPPPVCTTCKPPTPPVPPPTPPTPPAPPTPPVPPKPPAKCMSASRYSITVRPRNAQHGLVRFRLNGPYVRKVRWYVDMHRRGVQGERFESTSGKGGRVYRVYLWARPVFGAKLWGFHWVTVRATVQKGCTIHKRLHYFNNDPPLS